MNPLQTIRVAIRALLRNKMRSFLTTLGIIIGVAAVIAMVAIGEGAKAKVEQSFASMGSNLLIILPGSSAAGGARGGFGSMPTLTWDDLKAIRTEVPSVKYAAAQLRANAQIQAEDQNWSTSVYGTTPEYFAIRNWPVAQGAAMTDSDVDSSAKVVFLGRTVVTQLFGASADPVGQLVRIKSVPFEVAGVLEAKGQTPTGQDYDDAAFIPIKSFQTKIQGGLQNYITGVIFVGANSQADTHRAETQVSNLLRDRHHIQPGADDDFSIRNLTELASAQEEGTRTMTTLLAGIAAVSLLVGGIGIMNIMLVSVTERTREIGTRLAIGALEREVLWQFLVEAVVLSSLGGAIGIALSLLASITLSNVMHLPYEFDLFINLLAFGFSAGIGVLFGFMPAKRAARLDPIEALRHE